MFPLIETAVQEFLQALPADGAKPATVRWHKTRLQQFAAVFGQLTLDAVTVKLLRRYLADLQARTRRYVQAPQRREIEGSLSPVTVNGHKKSLKRFFDWCVEEYQLPANPITRIKLRLPRRKLYPRSVDPADVRLLLHATGEDAIGLRDRAILAFLMDTGCRAGGLLSLRIEHLDLAHRRALLNEKGDRERIVPFSPYTAEVLQAWLAVHPTQGQTVFCSLRTGERGNPLTLGGLHMIIRKLKRRAQISRRTNPHAFRHGFARQWIKAGGDVTRLSQIMGHSSITTTAIYAVFDDDELAEAHDEFSPMKHLKLNE